MKRRVCSAALIVSFSVLVGCTEDPGTSINPTPSEVLKPAAVDPAAETKKPTPAAEPEVKDAPKVEDLKADPTKLEEPKTEAPKSENLLVQSCEPVVADDADGVALDFVKFSEFSQRVIKKDAKLTMVDIWATFCAPCKENFPHVLEMQKKYGAKGLNVISLTIDDPKDAKAVKEVRKFLNEQKATITNLILDEKEDDRYEKLDLNVIPAVFLYDPSGKLIKRYTYDDPNDQFTYDQVESEVAAFLEGKPLPAKKPAK